MTSEGEILQRMRLGADLPPGLREVWQELVTARTGDNEYGGNVATIYAYHVFPGCQSADPLLADLPVATLEKIAAYELTGLLRRFVELYPGHDIGIETPSGPGFLVLDPRHEDVAPFGGWIHIEIRRREIATLNFVGVGVVATDVSCRSVPAMIHDRIAVQDEGVEIASEPGTPVSGSDDSKDLPPSPRQATPPQLATLMDYLAARKQASDAHALCSRLRHELKDAEQAHTEARTRAFVAREALHAELEVDETGYCLSHPGGIR
jgi:hypothetical protein